MKTSAIVALAVTMFAANASSQPFANYAGVTAGQALPEEMICRQCAAPDAEIAHVAPSGFDPVSATDAQLDLYGFPPRPDARKYPAAFAGWRALVTQPTTPVLPHLVPTVVGVAPGRVGNARGAASRRPATGTPNWYGTSDKDTLSTGYAVADASDPFDRVKATVDGTVIVPSVHTTGKCSDKWQYTRYMVAFDSSGDGESPEGGIEADAICKNGKTSTYYGAFYEWYPANSVAMTNLAVSPGDVVAIVLSVTSAKKVKLYVNDLTKGKSASISFKAPKGRSLVGDSAFWLLSRPKNTSTGNPLPLAGFAAVMSFHNYALAGNTMYSPSNAQSGSAYSYTLTGASNNSLAYTFTSPDAGMTYEDPSDKGWYLYGTALIALPGQP